MDPPTPDGRSWYEWLASIAAGSPLTAREIPRRPTYYRFATTGGSPLMARDGPRRPTYWLSIMGGPPLTAREIPRRPTFYQWTMTYGGHPSVIMEYTTAWPSMTAHRHEKMERPIGSLKKMLMRVYLGADLETHFRYAPGGPGMLEAAADFKRARAMVLGSLVGGGRHAERPAAGRPGDGDALVDAGHRARR